MDPLEAIRLAQATRLAPGAATGASWSFPDGMIGPDESIKGFRVEANDGRAGKVSWASYAPGESYLVINLVHHLHEGPRREFVH